MTPGGLRDTAAGKNYTVRLGQPSVTVTLWRHLLKCHNYLSVKYLNYFGI